MMDFKFECPLCPPLMTEPNVCLGHEERCVNRKKICELLGSPTKNPDENLRVLITKGSSVSGDQPQGAGEELCKEA